MLTSLKMVLYVFVGSLVFWKMRRRFAVVGVEVGGVIFLFLCLFICFWGFSMWC